MSKHINDGYDICELLEKIGGCWNASGVARNLGIDEGRVIRGLNAVRQGLCPPYDIPYVSNGAFGGKYQVINREETAGLPEDEHAAAGLSTWLRFKETMLRREHRSMILRAERETNPSKKGYLYQSAAYIQLAADGIAKTRAA